jgi:homotetrameric cytidine deaminase
LAAPRRNIEIKARDADPERTLELALALGAEDRGELAQRDTYFARASGRLKLREQSPGDAELIEYRREDAVAARASDYRVVAVPDPDALREALAAALGTLVVVEKRRRLFVKDGVRIHLDHVEGLGAFVELEAVAPEAGRDELERVRVALEIEDGALVAESYSDLLLDAPDLLLRAAEAAMRNAHAPYSGFRVGAALRAPSGGVYTGANVENASYPQGQCAEASAIGALVTQGGRGIAEIAVMADTELVTPCGGCRQRLSELAGPEVPVHLCGPEGIRRTLPLGDLLPYAFDAAAL